MISFCKEATVPAVDLDGKIIMQSPYEISCSTMLGPAAIFEAICNNPRVAQLLNSVEYVQICSIQNVLSSILDPALIGMSHS